MFWKVLVIFYYCFKTSWFSTFESFVIAYFNWKGIRGWNYKVAVVSFFRIEIGEITCTLERCSWWNTLKIIPLKNVFARIVIFFETVLVSKFKDF